MLRAKLAEIRWREVVAGASAAGLDLRDALWVGPPESDALRSAWFPEFPVVVESAAGSCTGDWQRIEAEISAFVESREPVDTITCLFGDAMWGAVVVRADEMTKPGVVRVLLELDGDQVVLVVAESALLVERTVRADDVVYELVEIMPQRRGP